MLDKTSIVDALEQEARYALTVLKEAQADATHDPALMGRAQIARQVIGLYVRLRAVIAKERRLRTLAN